MNPTRDKPVHPITPPKPVPSPTDVPTRPTPPGNPVSIVLAAALALAACGQQAEEPAYPPTVAAAPAGRWAHQPPAVWAPPVVPEAVMILSSARTPALQHYRATGSWPTDAQLDQLVPIQSGTYTQNLRTGAGLSLEVDYKGVSQGVVKMLYEDSSGTWLCQAEGLPDTMLPPSCR